MNFLQGAGAADDPAAARRANAEIDALSARYEELCRQGAAEDLRQFVARAPRQLQDNLFVECLLIKVWSDGQGERPYTLDDALRDFPERASLVQRCFPVPASSTPAGREASSDRSSADGETAGLSCGHYQIVCRIGRGSFGDVYRAFDQKLQRPVALKVCRFPFRAAESARVDILREGRTMARLDHPGIVPVYDVGTTDDGRPFVVSRLATGGNLETWAAARKPSPHQSAAIAATVAEALQFAHQHGVVHRDVKLANIFMEPSGQPVLGDFGLALREDERRGRRDELTGSRCYMTPEQILGNGIQIDGRTDLWALGVCLYKLLTGEFPFPDDGTDVVFEEILHRAPRPPRQIDPQIPAPLEAIVLKCLQKQVPDRYNSAADLAAALRQWIEQTSEETASAIAARSRRAPAPFWGVVAGGLLLAAAAASIAILAQSWDTMFPGGSGKNPAPTPGAAETDSVLPPAVPPPSFRGETASDVRGSRPPADGFASPRTGELTWTEPPLPSVPQPAPMPDSDATATAAASVGFTDAWRLGETPAGFTEIAIDGRSQTVEAALDVAGDFVLTFSMNVENQGPRNGEGVAVDLVPRSEGEAFNVKIEVAQAFSNGRTLLVHWPGSGFERISVARGLRTVRLTRRGRNMTLEVDGQSVKPTKVVPAALWLAPSAGQLRLTLSGSATRISHLSVQPLPAPDPAAPRSLDD